MERFVENPNLPRGRVSLGIIDGRVRKSLLSTLDQLNIGVITTNRCINLYEAVSYHPDMFFHHLGRDNIIAAPNAPRETIDTLNTHGFNIIKGDDVVLRNYPYNISYNVARIDEYAICNKAYTDKRLLMYLNDMGVKIIDVKQGYAKCSICIVDIGALITSDDGLHKTLSRIGFDVLKICSGDIELPGLNYGFIGGASGLVDKNVIAFTGNVMLHPDFKKIENFLNRYDKKIKVLDYKKLLDVGTFIPLKEYCIEEIC